jgi:hypothetical protein
MICSLYIEEHHNLCVSPDITRRIRCGVGAYSMHEKCIADFRQTA